VGYFECLWSELSDVQPEAFERRRAFLLAALAPGARVLDVGCGSGWFAEALAGAGFAVTGEDVAEGALALARARAPDVRFARGAEASLPFADASFDAAWLGEVLEHVQDGLGLLAEVIRVLTPGGQLIATTPSHGPLLRLRLALSARAFERHFEPRSDHVRFFTQRTLTELLQAAGFEQVAIAASHGLLLATARTPALR
jgi:ubiquinone/menaquinone biosynthesis C-methylase UbiE